MPLSALIPPTAGSIDLRCHGRGGQRVGLDLAAKRPVVARLLAGKDPDAARRLLPMVFSVCGQAQRVVAEAALQAAGASGSVLTPALAAAVGREQIVEHLWRLLLDWPALLTPAGGGEMLPAREFALWARRLRHPQAADDRRLAADLVAFVDGPAWAGHEAALLTAVHDLESARPARRPRRLPSGVALLQGLAEVDAEGEAVLREAYCRRPIWGGLPAETGSFVDYADQSAVVAFLANGRPLAARLAARFCALRAQVEIFLGGGAPAPAILQPDPGVGLATLETARGALVHRAVLVDGRIAEYAVLAPTEWNFHPDSAWAADLADTLSAQAEAPARVERRLRAWALALDPCVPLKLTMEREV